MTSIASTVTHRRDQTRVEALALSILLEGRGMSSFTTAEGIGILSKGEEVLSAYRRPSREGWLTEEVVRSVYDPMGIAFLDSPRDRQPEALNEQAGHLLGTLPAPLL